MNASAIHVGCEGEFIADETPASFKQVCTCILGGAGLRLAFMYGYDDVRTRQFCAYQTCPKCHNIVSQVTSDCPGLF